MLRQPTPSISLLFLLAVIAALLAICPLASESQAQTPPAAGEVAQGAAAASDQPANAAEVVCPPPDARVTDAYRVSDSDRPRNEVKLGDVIAVKVVNLGSFLDACSQSDDFPVVLFVEGHPLKKLTAYPPTNPEEGVLHFTLEREGDSKEAWNLILGRPDFDLGTRPVSISVGAQDRYPIASNIDLNLRVVPIGRLLAWALIFLALVGAFAWCVLRTNIIRNGQPYPVTNDWRGPYSLAKTQAAWWFFIILAGYILIGIITRDYSSSFNVTALALLGIGAGTALGSAAIDASKSSSPLINANQDQARQNGLVDEKQLQQEIDALKAKQADPNLDAAARAQVLGEIAAKETRYSEVVSAYRKLTNQSENFFQDIVSDANGVSFHRFQIVAWTVVLSVVFVREVWVNLAMPVFDATLLGLQGLSAATFLGLKTTEASVPDVLKQ